MNTLLTQSPSVNPNQERRCPYLGFKDDRETALSYPSLYNCCHHAKPLSPVSVAHQRKYCLAIGFSGCPVYKSDKPIPLPKEIRGTAPGERKIKPWMSILGVSLLILVGAIAGALFGVITIPGIRPMNLMRQDTMIPIVETIPSGIVITMAPTITPTPELPPTQTNTPVVPTAIAPHLLETPIGYDTQFVLHRIIEGEGFILLANTYNTSEQAIKAINYDMENLLFANKVIVIPLNTSDVSNLPAFSVYEVQDEGLTIESVAAAVDVDVALLIKYNELVAGYELTMGEWLLIPR